MPDAGISVFRVSLRPKLYRDIEIPGGKMLSDLAQSIVRSFDFDLDHCYGFYSLLKGNILRSPIKYELFADMEDIGEPSDAGSVERTAIRDVFGANGHKKMTFLFDYGDSWHFLVELIGQNAKEKGVKYPRVLAKVGKAPEQYPMEEEDEDE